MNLSDLLDYHFVAQGLKIGRKSSTRVIRPFIPLSKLSLAKIKIIMRDF